MKKKTSNVPVFLIYAGIIHAIGLALLMPMLVTLPGPGSSVGSQPAAIDVEIIPGSAVQANIDRNSEQTSALPAAPSTEKDAAVEPEAEAVANVGPAVEPEGEAKPEPDSPAEEVKQETKTKVTAPAKETATAKPRAAKKPVAQRGRTAKPAVKRAAKTAPKIAPFNGALSGLFSPGAPANNRRR